MGEMNTDKVKIYTDMSYGPYERNIYDLFLPKNKSGEMGMVLYLHGGGWVLGCKPIDKDEQIKLCAKYGLVFASINYRYTNEETTGYDIIDDITSALKVIKAKAAEEGYNITKMILKGVSAGAHLSLYYAYAMSDVSPIKPVAVHSLCGPADLSHEKFVLHNDIKEIIEILSNLGGYKFDRDTYAEAIPYLKKLSPISYLDKNPVPTIICHGPKDTLVPFESAVTLKEELQKIGVRADFIEYPNSDHGLCSDKESGEESDRMFEIYLKEYLGAD